MRAHVIAAGGAWDEELSRREAAEDSVNPGASVVMVDAVDAGILLVERLPREVRLRTLYLLPDFQGRGIGCSLVSALQKEAAARAVPMRLHVLKVNPAKRFYERLGFGVEEETEYFFYMRYAT
jgi:ribosomal protein S18 acetylase RimI-like enzyme